MQGLQSSNPVLTDDATFQEYYAGMGGVQQRENATTIEGVVNKTALLVGIAVLTGCFGYWLSGLFPSAVWISSIVALIVVIGVYFALRGKPERAPIVAPIYAAVEGVFLGALTGAADAILAAQNIAVAGGVGVQAFIVTMAVVLTMLGLYKAKILRPTKTFQAVVMTATGAIFLAYIASFVMMLIFKKPMPLISFASAVQDQGAWGLLGLGINVFILLIASLWLIMDFKLVEDQVSAGAPKYMEWYCGFALLVTLAWIYYEAVKLVVRIAVLFGNRE